MGIYTRSLPRSVLHDQTFFHFLFLLFLFFLSFFSIFLANLIKNGFDRRKQRMLVRIGQLGALRFVKLGLPSGETRRYHIPPSIGQGVVLGEILRPAMQLVRQVSSHLRSRWNGL